MGDGKELSRRAFLGGITQRGIETDPIVSRSFDLLAPDSSTAVRRLTELQEQEGEISTRDMIHAIGDVFPLFPVTPIWYDVDKDTLQRFVQYTLPLGQKKMMLAHSYFDSNGSSWEEAAIHFCPDAYSTIEVSIYLDELGEDTNRSNIGSFASFRPLIKMSTKDEDEYGNELREQGFYAFDRRVCLEAIRQAIVLGKNSTYWEDEVFAMLRLDELIEFNRMWYLDLLERKGMSSEFYEILTNELPVDLAIETDRRMTRMSRFDAMSWITKKGRSMIGNLIIGTEKNVTPNLLHRPGALSQNGHSGEEELQTEEKVFEET